MKTWVRLRIEGLNIDRQFEQMIKSGVVAKNIIKRGKTCIEFDLASTQKNKAIAFFESECYNILTINNAPLVTFLDFLKKRFILPLLIVCFSLATFWLDDFIWRVEIAGEIENSAVEQVLIDNGVWIGSNKQINLDYVENLLCNNLPQINYAIVSVKGCTLFVDVYKKTVPQDIVDENSGQNLYANCDGVISRILLISGTAKVSIGDHVKKGQLLIEGVRTFPDGSTQPTRAIGEVFADVCVQESLSFDKYISTVEKTGRSKNIFSLRLFGFEFNSADSGYSFSVEEKTQHTFFPLPITISNVEVYEAREKKQEVHIDEQECKEKTLAKVAEKTGDNYKNAEYSLVDGQEKLVVTAKIFVEQRIDTY